ncbi:cellulase family glycosylhydrolase [Planctomicrobium sp. SH668]|uniref:cellulase family glycosylhydrolase n=1 Tax=Planctomicrobium sp. SH668 TaxID=3448126 RepID=UPI003F5C37F0
MRTTHSIRNGLLILSGILVCSVTGASEMERIDVRENPFGFVTSVSRESFVPWGHNYASADLLERVAKSPDRVAREFAEMKSAGTNVVRIHPEMPLLLNGPTTLNPEGVEQLKFVLRLAEKEKMYLKVTGLACYKMSNRLDWYDNVSEEERWKIQAFFWEEVAKICADSPAVFAYDLVNEPGVCLRNREEEPRWYTGQMGDVEFCQWLTLEPGDRTNDQIFTDWVKLMVGAIRKHDSDRLITIGMLPFPGTYRVIAEQLDFVSPHIYPHLEKVDEAIDSLKKFEWNKPIVIGETFPLTCTAEELKEFFLASRGISHGWIGHWPDESPVELAQLKADGKATIQNLVWLSWVDLFKEIGKEMTTPPAESAPAP